MRQASSEEVSHPSGGHDYSAQHSVKEAEQLSAVLPAHTQPPLPPPVSFQAADAQQPTASLPAGKLVQPLPRPPSLMSAATLEAVGLAAPRQPTWAFQHATSGLFAPVLDVPGSRSAPTLSFAVPAAPLPAQAGLLVKGHPLSSSSGSLQMSCQLPPAGGQPQTLAAALRPPSEGTSSDVPPMLSAASDEAGASAGDSRAGGTQLLGQKAGMRQVDSQGSLAQDDSESSEREDGSKQPRAKKPRLVWTSELHQRFINAVTHLGVKNAVPKTILQLMNVDGMTRENVASHLQKYRQQLRRFETWGDDPQASQSAASQAQSSLTAGAAVAAGLYGLPQGQIGGSSPWPGLVTSMPAGLSMAQHPAAPVSATGSNPDLSALGLPPISFKRSDHVFSLLPTPADRSNAVPP